MSTSQHPCTAAQITGSSSRPAGGPLAGVRILDLSMFVAGPMTTMLLAEQGADVIKLEPPGGEVFRLAGTSKAGVGAWWIAVNRGKRSIVVDLKKPEGAEVAQRLARGADVLLHQYRPGVAERFGLGWEQVRSHNERLVYASVSGFGTAGPLAGQRVYDNTIQAYAGLNVIQGGDGPDGPQSVKTSVVDKIVPPILAQAVTAALFERERSGMGQQVTASMLASTLWWLWPDALMDHTFLDANGVTRGEGPRNYRNMIFATADGYISALTSTESEFRGLATAVGHEEWLDDPCLGDPDWRNRHRNDVFDLMSKELRGYLTADILARLMACDVPAARANAPEDILDEPQVLLNGMVATLTDPVAGEIRQPAPPTRFSRTATVPRPAPKLGADTRAVLREAGFSGDQVDALYASRAVA